MTDHTLVANSRRNRRRSALSGAARFRKWWVPYVWLAIPVAVVVYFYIYPFFNTLLLSFTNASPLTGRGDFVGLQSYERVLGDKEILGTPRSTPSSMPTDSSAADDAAPAPGRARQEARARHRLLFRSIYYIPAVSSLVVISLAWSSILKDNGMVNNFLVGTGLIDSGIPFLTGRWWLIISAVLITVWSGLPYYMIMYLAALANVDRSLYEAAEMDGASAVSQFFHVTIPGVRLMMALVATLTTIGSIKIFTEIHLLSNGTGGIGGKSETLTMYIRKIGLDPTYGSLGEGSAAAVALFVLTLGLVILQQVLNRKES